MHIQIIIGIKFQLNLTILIFWTKFTQKGYFWLETEKVNITIKFWCEYQISAATNNFDFLGQICQKMDISRLTLKIRIFACLHGRFLLY